MSPVRSPQPIRSSGSSAKMISSMIERPIPTNVQQASGSRFALMPSSMGGISAIMRRPPAEPVHSSSSARAVKGGRRITRWVDEHLLAAMEQRVRSRPEVMRQRKQLVEHPFGTMKRWWEAGYFLMRGLEKVRTEFSLTVLAYNLRRVVNLVEMPRLLGALG